MNEKIKQLAEQAKEYAENIQNDPLKIYTLECFNEKFAELIVRECIGMLDDEDDYGPYSTGIRSAAYRIKKHFGVEE